MEFPFTSSTRRVICPGVSFNATLWLVPETAVKYEYSARAPSTANPTHAAVPFKQAAATVCCPSLRGPTVSVLVAIPFASEIAVELSGNAIAAPVCHVTDCPLTDRKSTRLNSSHLG